MSEPNDKRALLIGIANYRYEPWNLDGPRNDLVLMKRMLKGQFGFQDEKISTLRDKEATRQGILDAFDRLVEATQKDDIVVIYYAGHGSQMTCRAGDEPDGLDETIVPWDSSRKNLEDTTDANADIIDDEIHDVLLRLGEKTSHITLIFDCCHSGTITRDAFATKVRAVETDDRPACELPPSPQASRSLTRSTRDVGPSGWLSISDKYVMIAGCADSEQAAEKRVEGDHFGALTYFLTEEIRHAGRKATYRDVFEGMKARVTANHSSQHPQMEGMLDKVLFGVEEIRPMRYLPVEARTDDEVVIGGGAAHGLTVGSRWAVVPKGESEVTEDTARLGEVEITSVGPVESKGKILPESESGPPIEAGCRAVETLHSYGDLRLRCEIVAPPGYEAEAGRVREEIADRPHLTESTEGEPADIRAYLVDRAAPGGEEPAPGIPIVAPTWVAIGEAGDVVAPLKPIGEEEPFVENLASVARFRQALALRNPDPDSWLADRVEMNILRILDDGTRVPAEPEGAGGTILFEEGEEYEIEIVNHDTESVYLNLLGFDAGGQVSVYYPKPQFDWKDALPAGETLKRRPKRGNPSLPRFEAGFPAPPFPFGRVDDDEGGSDADEALETFKLFVTTDPADFSFLEQGGMRSVTGMSPIESLMASAAGCTTRGSDMIAPEEVSDWTTLERSILVRRKRTKELDPEGGTVQIGSAKISSPGLAGDARAHGWQSSRAEAVQMRGGDLTSAFAATGVQTRQTIELANTRAAEGPVTRSTTPAGDPGMELELTDPGAELGQMVLATNEGGLLSWHFPEPVEEAATRSADGGGRRPGPRRFVLSASVEESPGVSPDEPRRGLIGAIGKKIIQELVFPLVDPAIGVVGDFFVGKFEEKRRPYRLRGFTPENYRSGDAPPLGAEDWDRLASGRALLLLHGAFMQSHTGFASMPPEFIEALARRYEGRVFAFDHFTLSQGPRENVEWLIRHLPTGISLDLDLLCHARGGLVGRVLSEQQGELSSGSRRVRIGNVVFAGAPNAGTELADPKHLGSLIDRYTNILNIFDFIPIDTGVVEVLETIISVAKQVSLNTLQGLDGLQAMVPGGAFQRWLDSGRATEDTRYYALASDFRSEDPALRALIAGVAARKVFGKAGNDLVVPTSSVYDRRRAQRPLPEGVADRRNNGSGGATFPIRQREVFEATQLGHFDYFSNGDARSRILEWLST